MQNQPAWDHTKTDEPIFVKQFKIPDAHMEEVENMSSNG